ncbi:hypothetical protein FA95DRAFT_1231347 [Auriscalpium vulgare]|uniref:Uncharacterized protein n=1 Tax=Auriscalpium vulgare TaxID=40419 RepID=A0ACB8RUQ5_9AGAM|nr:hypothetical protein FA95DRAFT_1231347 [Auriscalpium vulgare]
MCPFSGVPNEILELIVVNVDAPRDLRALACVCRSLRRVISPRHLEYREVTITSGDSAVWVHLAQRPDLARNVRRLTLQQWSEPESRLPTTLVATHAAKACAECPRVRAVRNMVNLSTVVVNGWKTSLAYLLRYCPHELKDVFLNDPDVPLAPNHPIWAMRGLRKLAIPNMDHQLVKNAGQRLVNFISRSAQLEVRSLRYSY